MHFIVDSLFRWLNLLVIDIAFHAFYTGFEVKTVGLIDHSESRKNL